MDSIRVILSRNLQTLRKEKGLSQSELAEKAGFQHASYNRWENGKSWPEPDTIAALATALGVPESRLFYDNSLANPPDQPNFQKAELIKDLENLIKLHKL